MCSAEFVLFACYQGELCTSSSKMHFPVSSVIFQDWAFWGDGVTSGTASMCKSCAGEVLVILYQGSCCGGSRVVWITPSPSSVIVFSFALVSMVYFKVWFTENMHALYDRGNGKGPSLACRLVFLHSVWFSAILSCSLKVGRKGG